MKKITILLFLAIVITVSISCADIIIADGSNLNIIERYTDTGSKLWSIGSGRSITGLTLNKSGELVFASKQGIDRMLTTFGEDGTYYDDRYHSGTHTVDSEWLANDFDGDGKVELAVSSRTSLDIVSVDDTEFTNTKYTTIASYTVADTFGSNGTGGTLLLGKDYTGDGIRDIIATKGGNSSGNRINIWDPATGDRIASYTAEECRGVGDMIFGKDQNGDGIEDLWVCDKYLNQIRAYDLSNNGAYIGTVNLGFTIRFPQDILETEDGTVYISTRFATSLSEASLGSNYGNLIKYEPATATSSLILDTAGANYTTITYIPPVLIPCDDLIPGDFNHDCLVDIIDLTSMASQWLISTDPANNDQLN